MVTKGNPLENPVAEGINGIIKNDFLFHYKVQNLSGFQRNSSEDCQDL